MASSPPLIVIRIYYVLSIYLEQNDFFGGNFLTFQQL